eukprot:1573825-Amphidinium_carterae.1
MAMFGAGPIACTDFLDSPPPQRTGAQSFVATAPAHPVTLTWLFRVICTFSLVWHPETVLARAGSFLVPLGQTSVLASQTATHALGDQGSVGLRSTSVFDPHEGPRVLRCERQVSMDSGRGQIALPRLDQMMLEDMNEPQHLPTIHENARVYPLTLDIPWSRVRTSNHATCVSMDNDLSRSRSRQFCGMTGVGMVR